jgi:hypothetical protein
MPCALTQGYTLDCRDNSGGAKDIWIMEIENVSGITASGGIITGITKVTGKRFWKYQQERGVPEAKEVEQSNTANGTVFFDQTIEMAVNKMSATRRNELMLLVQQRVVAVVQDMNDKYWYYGEEDGLTTEGMTAGTGKARGDRNGYSFTLTGQERYLAKEVATAAVLLLETAG